jgi:hypothetical protein
MASERQQHDIARLTQSFETRFASETIDPSWSRSIELTIRNELAPKATGSTVLESRCASTLCRIVLRHETPRSQRELAYAMSDLAPFRQGVFYSYDAKSNPPETTPSTTSGGRAKAICLIAPSADRVLL